MTVVYRATATCSPRTSEFLVAKEPKLIRACDLAVADIPFQVICGGCWKPAEPQGCDPYFFALPGKYRVDPAFTESGTIEVMTGCMEVTASLCPPLDASAIADALADLDLSVGIDVAELAQAICDALVAKPLTLDPAPFEALLAGLCDCINQALTGLEVSISADSIADIAAELAVSLSGLDVSVDWGNMPDITIGDLPPIEIAPGQTLTLDNDCDNPVGTEICAVADDVVLNVNVVNQQETGFAYLCASDDGRIILSITTSDDQGVVTVTLVEADGITPVPDGVVGQACVDVNYASAIKEFCVLENGEIVKGYSLITLVNTDDPTDVITVHLDPDNAVVDPDTLDIVPCDPNLDWECVKWLSDYSLVDNTGFVLNQPHTMEFTLSTGAKVVLNIPAAANWNENIEFIRAALEGALPGCVVEARCNRPAGCGGLLPPPSDVDASSMFARYVNITCCPGRPYPVEYKLLAPKKRKLISVAQRGEEKRGYRCFEACNPDTDIEWFDTEWQPIPEADLPVPGCHWPCSETLPSEPLSLCEFELQDGCDTIGSTDPTQWVPVIRVFEICEGQVASAGFFAEDADGGLVEYNNDEGVIGLFVDCDTGEVVAEPEVPCTVVCFEEDLYKYCVPAGCTEPPEGCTEVGDYSFGFNPRDGDGFLSVIDLNGTDILDPNFTPGTPADLQALIQAELTNGTVTVVPDADGIWQIDIVGTCDTLGRITGGYCTSGDCTQKGCNQLCALYSSIQVKQNIVPAEPCKKTRTLKTAIECTGTLPQEIACAIADKPLQVSVIDSVTCEWQQTGCGELDGTQYWIYALLCSDGTANDVKYFNTLTGEEETLADPTLLTLCETAPEIFTTEARLCDEAGNSYLCRRYFSDVELTDELYVICVDEAGQSVTVDPAWEPCPCGADMTVEVCGMDELIAEQIKTNELLEKLVSCICCPDDPACEVVETFTCVASVDLGGLFVSADGLNTKASNLPEDCLQRISAANAAGNIVVIEYFDRFAAPVGTYVGLNATEGSNATTLGLSAATAPETCPGLPAPLANVGNNWNNMVVTVYAP